MDAPAFRARPRFSPGNSHPSVVFSFLHVLHPPFLFITLGERVQIAMAASGRFFHSCRSASFFCQADDQESNFFFIFLSPLG